MSKILKFFILLVIVLGVFLSSTNVYAVNMNLSDENTSNTNVDEETENAETNESTDTQETTGTISENIAQGNYTTQVTVSTQELTISNVCSICLIGIGIVLILFAIAILIKLK